MVFATKLRQPEPRRRWSMLEVARELGVQVEQVKAALAAVGEYVKSERAKAIEEPVVRKLYEQFGREYVPDKPKTVPTWRTRDQGGPPPRSRSSKRSAGGVEGPQRFEAVDGSLGLGHRAFDTSDTWALEEWKLYGFSLTERDAWRDAGLRDGQAKLARDYRDAGLLASDLSKRVGGWTVAKRLRDNESPKYVLGLLRQSNVEKTG